MRKRVVGHLGRAVLRGQCTYEAAAEVLGHWSAVKRGVDYYEPENSGLPFPGHLYYEGKAWGWLKEQVQHLTPPILFWNAGS